MLLITLCVRCRARGLASSSLISASGYASTRNSARLPVPGARRLAMRVKTIVGFLSAVVQFHMSARARATPRSRAVAGRVAVADRVACPVTSHDSCARRPAGRGAVRCGHGAVSCCAGPAVASAPHGARRLVGVRRRPVQCVAHAYVDGVDNPWCACVCY